MGLLMACVRASAFSVILLLCAAPSVPSAGAFLLSCRWASWCPHAACPSVATGPTRAPLPRARPPSRRPPSQGKWGPLGCSPPGVLWAPWRHGSSPRLCSPCGLAHGVASSGAAHPLFGPRPPLAPPSRARLPFRRPLSQGKWRPRPRPRTFFFSLEALQSGRGRRPPTKTRQAGAPNAGQKEDEDTSREKKRTKTPSTDAKAEVWSSGALLRLLPWHPTRNPARRKTRAKPLAPAPLETSATEGASTRRAEGRPHVRCASARHQRRRQPQCQRQRQPLAPAASARR